MVQLEETRVTHRDIDEVFDYVADFASTAEYDPGVTSARRTTPRGPVREGTTWRVDTRFLGVPLPMDYRIERLDPPHRIVLSGTGLAAVARDDIRLEATESGGTVITWRLDIELKSGPIAERLLAPLLRRLGRRALDGLAAQLARPRPL